MFAEFFYFQISDYTPSLKREETSISNIDTSNTSISSCK